jgi:hypothetical protein
MASCGIKVTRNPSEMGRLLKSVLRGTARQAELSLMAG